MTKVTLQNLLTNQRQQERKICVSLKQLKQLCEALQQRN